MKVSSAHLAAMREAIHPLDTFERRAIYRAGTFPRADRVTDLDKRYRWDLLWLAIPVPGPLWDIPGLTDAHIDTALRTIVPPLAADRDGNVLAEEGVTRCACGCKYWEHDRCIDCGLHADDDLVKGDD